LIAINCDSKAATLNQLPVATISHCLKSLRLLLLIDALRIPAFVAADIKPLKGRLIHYDLSSIITNEVSITKSSVCKLN
jgi:hypothetical protein